MTGSAMPLAAIQRWVADETWLKRALTAQRWMSRAYFEARYLIADPWHLETSPYEAERARASLLMLDGRRYASAMEVGCGEGAFTGRLLERCDAVVAVDFSALALRRARRRFAGDTRVDVRKLDVRVEGFKRTFELVFCAELFYYLNRAEREAVGTRLVHWLTPGGDLCLAHGTSVHDIDPAGGDMGGAGPVGARMLHEWFRQVPDLTVVRELASPRYRLTLFRRLEDARA